MMRAPRVCNVDGCYQQATESGRCEAHYLAARREGDKRRRRPQGYDARWRRLSVAYRKAHPTCALCPAPSAHVDHIDGLGPSGPRGHDWSNLQALCRSCHSRKTVQENGGFGHKARGR